MKQIYMFFLVLASSLSPFAGAANLEIISPGTESQVLLLESTGRSCRAQITEPEGADDLLGPTMPLGQFGLVWKGPGALKLSSIQVKWEGDFLPGGTQTQVLSGEDLAFTWSGSPQLGLIQPSELPQFSTPHCLLQFGGLQLRSSELPSSGYATLLLTGTTMQDGQEVPVQTQSRFHYHFDGLDLH